jgi:hypothetical protein
MNKDLLQRWMEFKRIENEAAENRRKIEDRMSLNIGLEEQNEGSKTHKVDGFVVKVSQRLNRKVDEVALHEIVAANGLEDHLNRLFRFKAEINKKEWDSTDESITGPLSDAITMKAGRPSYSILREE